MRWTAEDSVLTLKLLPNLAHKAQCQQSWKTWGIPEFFSSACTMPDQHD